MALYTVAFPRLNPADAEFIEQVRRAHDPRHAAIAAHFTLVFGCSALANDVYLSHVRAVAGQARSVAFVCREAVLGFDDDSKASYAFVVPDEGNGALMRLHDLLYEGPLAAQLRLDLPFIPHITVAASMAGGIETVESIPLID